MVEAGKKNMKGTILEEMGHTRNKYVFWIKTCQKLVIFDYFNEESSPTNGSLTKWWSKLTEWWKRLIALGRVKIGICYFWVGPATIEVEKIK